jgi:hypothetical protein
MMIVNMSDNNWNHFEHTIVTQQPLGKPKLLDITLAY